MKPALGNSDSQTGLLRPQRRSFLRQSLPALAPLALFVLPTAAQAMRVAVHVPAIESDLKISEGRRSKFHETLVAGLSGAGGDTTVLRADEVRSRLAGKSELLACQFGACLGKVANALDADRLIVPRIGVRDAVGGASYKISIAVYDRAGNPLPITGNDSCGSDVEGCVLAKALESMRRSTASIAGEVSKPAASERPAVAAAPGPGPGSTTSTPAAGAMATAPSGAATSPGPTTTTPAATSLPSAGDPGSPAGAGGSDGPQQPSPYAKVFHYGWMVAAGTTAAFIVMSIPFLSYAGRDGDTTCGPDVPSSRCPTIYTGNLGSGLGLLLGGGLVSAGVFGALFYLDHKEHKRMKDGKFVALPPNLLVGSQGVAMTGGFRF